MQIEYKVGDIILVEAAPSHLFEKEVMVVSQETGCIKVEHEWFTTEGFHSRAKGKVGRAVYKTNSFRRLLSLDAKRTVEYI